MTPDGTISYEMPIGARRDDTKSWLTTWGGTPIDEFNDTKPIGQL